MNIPKVMDTILGAIIEDISRKFNFECKRMEGYLFIDGPDRSVGVKYINDESVEVMAEYINEPGVKIHVSIIAAPTIVMKLLTETCGAKQKRWWEIWK